MKIWKGTLNSKSGYLFGFRIGRQRYVHGVAWQTRRYYDSRRPVAVHRRSPGGGWSVKLGRAPCLTLLTGNRPNRNV